MEGQTEKPVLLRLNEVAKLNKLELQWTTLSEEGPPHSRTFTMQLIIGSETYQGTGQSKKKAQIVAAEACLLNTALAMPPAKMKLEVISMDDTAPSESSKRPLEAESECSSNGAKKPKVEEVEMVTENAVSAKPPLMAVYEMARFNNIEISFTIANETGPPHAKTFEAVLKLGEETYRGSGSSHKKAQTMCAEAALQQTQHKRPVTTKAKHARHHCTPPAHSHPQCNTQQPPNGERVDVASVLNGLSLSSSDAFQSIDKLEGDLMLPPSSQVRLTQEETRSVERVVNRIETALKLVSDAMLSRQASPRKMSPQEDASVPQQPRPRSLLGVLRVGLLGDGLLTRGDGSLELVLLFAEKPTQDAVTEVYRLLVKELVDDAQIPIHFDVLLHSDGVIRLLSKPISSKQPNETGGAPITVRIHSTSVACSRHVPITPDPPRMLDMQLCQHALVLCRRSRWFNCAAARIRVLPALVQLLRCWGQHYPPLGYMPLWLLQVFAEQSLADHQSSSIAVGLRIVLDRLASGALLPGSELLLADPCEKSSPNLVEQSLSELERHEITNAARTVLASVHVDHSDPS